MLTIKWYHLVCEVSKPEFKLRQKTNKNSSSSSTTTNIL